MIANLAAAILATQAPTLTDLEKQAALIKPGPDWTANLKQTAAINSGVVGLVEQDKLKADEFERASQIISPANDFRLVQMRYELSLAALSAGDNAAAKTIGAKWDELLVALGRNRRIGMIEFDGGEKYELKPTAQCIVAVLNDPEKAKKAAEASELNPEIQAIVDADQKDRQADWTKLTMKQIEDLATNDRKRLLRIRELVATGSLKNAKDFWAAALVLQHGHTFNDYALAHELSVCSIVLGSPNGPWLSGASYDRLLINSGHPQRFATQYGGGPNGFELNWHDPQKINDTMRVAVVKRTLAEAKARKF